MNEIELPKSVFLSLAEYDFEKMNNIPVYAHEKTLQEISENEPLLATKIISNTLSYERNLKADIQIISNIGIISSEMDGDSIAYGVLERLLKRNIAGDKIIEPLDIVISTFIRMGIGRNFDKKLVSIPKFIINLQNSNN
jgi:hypothetical protein